MRESKIGLLEQICASKRYHTFFLGHPVHNNEYDINEEEADGGITKITCFAGHNAMIVGHDKLYIVDKDDNL